jgi:hypothetical protein
VWRLSRAGPRTAALHSECCPWASVNSRTIRTVLTRIENLANTPGSWAGPSEGQGRAMSSESFLPGFEPATTRPRAPAFIAQEAAAVRRFDCCMPTPNPPLLAQDRTPLGLERFRFRQTQVSLGARRRAARCEFTKLENALTLQHSRPALRSCGNSAKPKGGEGHETDEKCVIAGDQIDRPDLMERVAPRGEVLR